MVSLGTLKSSFSDLLSGLENLWITHWMTIHILVVQFSYQSDRDGDGSIWCDGGMLESVLFENCKIMLKFSVRIMLVDGNIHSKRYLFLQIRKMIIWGSVIHKQFPIIVAFLINFSLEFFLWFWKRPLNLKNYLGFVCLRVLSSDQL